MLQVAYTDDSSTQIWLQGASDQTLDRARQQNASRYITQTSALSTIGLALGQVLTPDMLTRPVTLLQNDIIAQRVMASQERLRASSDNATSVCTAGLFGHGPLVQDGQTAALLLRQQFPDYGLVLSRGLIPDSRSAVIMYYPIYANYDYASYQTPPNGTHKQCQQLSVQATTSMLAAGLNLKSQSLLDNIVLLQRAADISPGSDAAIRHLLGAVTNTCPLPRFLLMYCNALY